MAGTVWTSAQLEAINAENNNILVSAAAGSGKTAVLVERVIRMITREQNPLDLDRLVIVTFTRAAASQMKTKIYRAVREKLKEDPGNLHLANQLMKVQTAKICTIDALCLAIVRENIQDVDLDPDFRMGDEASLEMLKRDTLKSMLEDCYHTAEPTFMDVVQYYTDRNDNKLEDIILALYSFSQSHPEPYAWIRSCVYPYLEAKNLQGFGEAYEYPDGSGNWLKEFAGIISDRIEEICSMARQGIEICRRREGPWPYEDFFQGILDLTAQFDGQTFDFRAYEIRSLLADWPPLPRITAKNTEINAELKTAAAEIRKEMKKRFEDLRDNFLYDDLENIFREMAACSPIAVTISKLVMRFSKEYENAKKQKHLTDFSDIAHYALKILIRYNDRGEIIRTQNGQPVYTETADRMASSIDQVIVDEYQDTNMLQEYLVRAIGSERSGRPDIFMVGDVKQSIYGFRMACPELFNEKLDHYAAGCEELPADQGRLIILDRNFRSRREVLDLTNLVFGQSMIRKVGGIDYSRGHALAYGELYDGDPQSGPERFVPEIMLLEGSGEQAKYREGYLIAARIEGLLQEGFSLSDIAVLTRTSDNPQIERVLHDRGIPMIKQTGQGFFSCFEIRLLLDLLQIIDNPRQDIPFAAVLYSPLCMADARDLAQIRLSGEEGDSLYKCLIQYDRDHAGRFSGFLEKLAQWRNQAAFMGVCEFLDTVLEESGLNVIFAAMPQGKDRLANIDMFKAKAGDFSKGGYSGLFEFLCYIRNLVENGIDFGARNSLDSGIPAVQMMTIHRSKGLEFPVVIIAGCGKKYNETDLNDSIIPDRSLGLGIEYRDPESRMIKKTAFMQTLRHKKRTDLYAEEMRLLYVAMTRAKEKLIITGTDRFLSSRIKSWELPGSAQRQMQAYEVMHAGSFLYLLGAALYPYKDAGHGFILSCFDEYDVQGMRAGEMQTNETARQALLNCLSEEMDISPLLEKMNYEYPFRKAAHMLGKITASALEKLDAAKSADPAAGTGSQAQETDEDYMDTDRLQGKERGNAYHRFFELMDYHTDLDSQLDSCVSKGLLSREYAGTIDREKIQRFLDSSLGQRMRRALENGKLYRERQFVMGYVEDVNSVQTLTGSKYHSDVVDNELLLVQGIIDAWFKETDEDGRESVILVDYKTDRVQDRCYYMEKYSPQLNAYADALERSTHLPVRERIIYSLELDSEICL